MRIDDGKAGFEDGLAYFNVDGKLCHSAFDSMAYYRSKLVVALDAGFARATSVAEFGAGLGRNLLFLKKAMPHLTLPLLGPCLFALACATAQPMASERQPDYWAGRQRPARLANI